MNRSLIRLSAVVCLALLPACSRTPEADRRDVVLVTDESASPMKLRASFHYGAGYSAPVEALSIRGKPSHIWPTALIVAGCAHSEMTDDFPKGVLQVSVDENPHSTLAPTLAEACVHRDAGEIRNAVRARLTYLLSSIQRLDVADPNRLVIFASGEAAPVAAEYVANARGKVLLGDPCLVAWPRTLDAETPTIVLRGSEVSGLKWGTVEVPRVTMPASDNPAAIRSAISASAEHCSGQKRVDFPPNYAVVEGPGRVEMFSRPVGVREAGRDFMSGLFAR